MKPDQRKSVFLTVIDWLAYLGLFAIGIYFILKAEVWQRYQLGRTNYAEYEEHVTERPTIIAYFSPATISLKYGQDYNMSYKILHDEVNLTTGANIIHDDFSIDFEEVALGNMFKITPLKPKEKFNDHHAISFVFDPSKLNSVMNITMGDPEIV